MSVNPFNPKCPKLPWMVDFYTSDDGKVYDTQLQAAFANTTLDYLSCLNIKSKPAKFKETQLVCSISANTSCNTIEEMLQQGMSVAKIVGTSQAKILETMSKIHAVTNNYSRKLGRVYPLAIALEIKGPEIRTGILKGPENKIYLEKGKITNITTNPSYEEHVTEDMIYVDYENFPAIVHPGDKVLLDNGSVTLSALECVESIIRCIVERAGQLLSNASVIVQDAPIEMPMVSASDKELLKLSIHEHVDYLFLSGIYSKEGILEVKDLLGEEGKSILIFPKIDSLVSIENVNKILEISDGICLDCDRLMVELPKEKVFLVQKSILAKCNLAGKPCVCTIKISDLRSISKSEVCDIANAVLDGADALLIPPEACIKDLVKSIVVICKEAEPAVYQKQIFNELSNSITSPMEALYALAMSAVESALKTNAAAVICLTSSGRTAKLLSRFKPRCPIIAITRYIGVAKQLCIFRGVEPILYLKSFGGNWDKDVAERVQLGVTYGKYIGYIRMGDAVVTVTGSRPECGMPNNIQDFRILNET
ncbi:hypothetical protein NQ318_014948 [Aromia moschata]|uniref:Pyruvate kinase n=1 Tax=Aromia moschata TaxID=1265417 RepID=A0AAV8XMN1_9CUCU|nr:hypothetical protein NQ318_014948 [Aromia moschata]